MIVAANDNSAPANAGALTFASVCSGIEAASVAFTPLGWRAVCFSEIEKFPSAVLAHHYPDVPNLGDFTKIDTKKLRRVDILCGGTPCQAFSVAGLRGSLDDARGNLSLEFVRLAHELAEGNGLRNLVWENVLGVLSTKDNAFGCFMAGLVGADDALPPPTGGSWPNAGMVSGPRARAAWCVFDAQHFGLAQRRKRVIVIADFGNGADPISVLFERKGMHGYSPTRKEEREGVAPTISARTKGGGGLGTDFDLDGGLRVVSRPLLAKGNDSFDESLQTYVPEIARCDATREGSSQDYESTTMVAVGVTGTLAHTLKAEGADASEDGTGRGTPIVAFALNSHAGCADGVATNNNHASGGPSGFGISEELAYSLRAGRTQSVAQTVALRGREGGATAELGGEVATALRASSGGGDKPHVLTHAADVAPTLGKESFSPMKSSSGQMDDFAIGYTSAVRRLTPKECERLQGFLDDYTAIPWRGKPASDCPDGPRYKALGNSWAVPLFSWLGARITRLMPPIAANDNNKRDIAAWLPIIIPIWPPVFSRVGSYLYVWWRLPAAFARL